MAVGSCLALGIPDVEARAGLFKGNDIVRKNRSNILLPAKPVI